jgi:hypothetical protein
MDVDPEWARLLRHVVEQETHRPEKNNERGNGPVEGDGGRAMARERRREALLGRENIHAIALSLIGGRPSPGGGGWCIGHKAFLWAGAGSRRRGQSVASSTRRRDATGSCLALASQAERKNIARI